MGLDAYVYCDCLERGKLEKPLPGDVTVKVEANGYPLVVRNGEEIWEDNPDWNKFACTHDSRSLLHHRLGNIGLISVLRTELSRQSSAFPILLQKVLYNGIHAGDFLPLDIISGVQEEFCRLQSFDCLGNLPKSKLRLLAEKLFLVTRYSYTSSSEANKFMSNFRTQMLELCEAAQRVGKPIAFS